MRELPESLPQLRLSRPHKSSNTPEPAHLFRRELKKIEAWVFYLIPQKPGGGGWSNFLSFQYSTKYLKDRLRGYEFNNFE